MRILSLFAVLLAAGGSDALRIAHETRISSSLTASKKRNDDDGVCAQCYTMTIGGKTFEYCGILGSKKPQCNFPKCDCTGKCKRSGECDNCTCQSTTDKSYNCDCSKGPTAICQNPLGTSTCASCKGKSCVCEVTQPSSTDFTPITTTCDCSDDNGASCTCGAAALQCVKRAATCTGCKEVCPDDLTKPCWVECNVNNHMNAACVAPASSTCTCDCPDNGVSCNCTCGNASNCMCSMIGRLARTPSRTAGV